MLSSKVVSLFLIIAVVYVNGGGIAAIAPVARLATPLLTNEVLTASAPALARAAPLLAASAPLLAPATIGYRTAIPQNIPPFAAQTNIVNRAFGGYYAAPFSAAFSAPIATPFAAPIDAPFSAAFSTPLTAPFTASSAAPIAAPFSAAFTTPFAAPFASPLLRSSFAFPPSPVVSSLPFVRSAFSAPLNLRSAVVPLQTQAFFGPAPVSAEIAPVGVTTKLSPVDEPASEDIPQSDEDQGVQSARAGLEANAENSSGNFARRPDEPSFVENDAPEEQSSN